MTADHTTNAAKGTLIDARRAVEAVIANDLGARPDVIVRERVDELLALRQRVDAALIAAAGAFDGRGCADGVRLTPTDYLADRGAMPRIIGGGKVAMLHPEIHDALTAGTLVPEVIKGLGLARRGRQDAFDATVSELTDALVTLAREGGTLDDQELVRKTWQRMADDALGRGEPDGGRSHRRLSLAPTSGGMVSVNGMLDQTNGALVLAAVAAIAKKVDKDDTRTVHERQADAFGELARCWIEHRNDGHGNGLLAAVDVVLDADTFVHIWHANAHDENPNPDECPLCAIDAEAAAAAEHDAAQRDAAERGDAADGDRATDDEADRVRRFDPDTGTDTDTDREPGSGADAACESDAGRPIAGIDSDSTENRDSDSDLDPNSNGRPGTDLTGDPADGSVSGSPANGSPANGSARERSVWDDRLELMRRNRMEQAAPNLAALDWFLGLNSTQIRQMRRHHPKLGALCTRTLQFFLAHGSIGRAVLTAKSEVLDLGRKTRYATAAQKRGKRLEVGGCEVRGCGAEIAWVEHDHIQPWNQDGPSDYANFRCFCGKHHADRHNGCTFSPHPLGGLCIHPPATAA